MDFMERIEIKRERLARLEEAFMIGFGMVVGVAIVMAFLTIIM